MERELNLASEKLLNTTSSQDTLEAQEVELSFGGNEPLVEAVESRLVTLV